MTELNENSTLGELLQNPKAKAILTKYAGEVLKNPMVLKMMQNMKIKDLKGKLPDKYKDTVDSLIKRIENS